MATNKSTPEPETYIEDGGECKPAYVHFADGVTIEVPAGPTNDAMPRARLIVAAPELLSALKALIEECSSSWAMEDALKTELRAARAAILRAEGK